MAKFYYMHVASFLRLLPLLLIFVASQVFWIYQICRLGARLISNVVWRRWLGAAGLAAYLFLLAYNLGWLPRGPASVRLTMRDALLEAPLRWWVVSSLLGFAVAVILWVIHRVFRAAVWTYRKVALHPSLPSRLGRGVGSEGETSHLARRQFLERAALAMSAAPFVACAYGLLYERVDLETTYPRIRLRRLPKAFHGFRIAQLSDIHIGPFMSAEEIRKYVAATNRLKPDVVVLTGDFVTWDAATQVAVVKSLAGLKAPFGVFGCLGNHEIWTGTEASITRLFAQEGIQILRQQSELIELMGERLNLIGVDFQTHSRLGTHRAGFVNTYLAGIEALLIPDTANVLLCHNPNAFDRASALGVDLTLSGHTHGGQVALEFVHRNISPSTLITKYIKGWFQKDGAQLYVNRGIGTIGVPIRLNAPPEITLFELAREA